MKVNFKYLKIELQNLLLCYRPEGIRTEWDILSPRGYCHVSLAARF
jgi:hypothetical protein